MERLTDLREILHYVPKFRDRLFVIAMDGAIVEDDNFRNLLLDVALLRTLRIQVVLVHGAGLQVRKTAEMLGIQPSDIDGTGITDPATLRVALIAANRVTHEILEGLSAADLRGASGNAVVAHPAGILQGIDRQLTGRVERIDTGMLQSLLEHDIIPVIPPLGCDGEGQTYRLNSDAVAVEVARALKAVKLIYLASTPGVRLQGQLLRHIPFAEAETILKKQRHEVPPEDLSKLEQAVRAAKEGVPRIHIIDGRLPEGLLAEVFSNSGVGTLIYANEYQAIRKAQKRDARTIYALIAQGMETDELLKRTRAELEAKIDDYFVFQVDGNIVACGALHVSTSDGTKAEMASLYVAPRYENQGIGLKLMNYAENLARQKGVKILYCLSTQAINYFTQKGGFKLGTPDDLPAERRAVYDRSGRRSQVLIKLLP